MGEPPTVSFDSDGDAVNDGTKIEIRDAERCLELLRAGFGRVYDFDR